MFVQPMRAGFRDHHGFGKYATGLTIVEFRIVKVDVEGEHHAWPEYISKPLERGPIRLYGMMTVARILKRCEAVTVNAGLAYLKTPFADNVADAIHRG